MANQHTNIQICVKIDRQKRYETDGQIESHRQAAKQRGGSKGAREKRGEGGERPTD